PGSNGRDDRPGRDQEPLSTSMRPPLGPSRALAQCFLRLSKVDPTLLHRVGSYEARLWRQAAQTIWTLEEIRRPPPAPTRRRFREPGGVFFWGGGWLKRRGGRGVPGYRNSGGGREHAKSYEPAVSVASRRFDRRIGRVACPFRPHEA